MRQPRPSSRLSLIPRDTTFAAVHRQPLMRQRPPGRRNGCGSNRLSLGESIEHCPEDTVPESALLRRIRRRRRRPLPSKTRGHVVLVSDLARSARGARTGQYARRRRTARPNDRRRPGHCEKPRPGHHAHEHPVAQGRRGVCPPAQGAEPQAQSRLYRRTRRGAPRANAARTRSSTSSAATSSTTRVRNWPKGAPGTRSSGFRIATKTATCSAPRSGR